MAAGANEADVIDKPGKAKIHEAKEAKADEADNAIVTDKAVDATEADEAKATDADKTDEAKANEADEAKAN